MDLTNRLVVCVPHSADPVLFGIRGENPDIVTEAAAMIRAEPVERFAVYRTNQGTDMHLLSAANVAEIRDMHSYRLEGTVSAVPKTIHGGHVIFPYQGWGRKRNRLRSLRTHKELQGTYQEAHARG